MLKISESKFGLKLSICSLYNISALVTTTSQSKIRGHAALRLLVYDCGEGCRVGVEDSYCLQSALRVMNEDDCEVDRSTFPLLTMISFSKNHEVHHDSDYIYKVYMYICIFVSVREVEIYTQRQTEESTVIDL